MKKILFKKALLIPSLLLLFVGTISTVVVSNQKNHTQKISDQDQKIKNTQKRLKDSGSYEWDEILLLQNQVEKQEQISYQNIHKDWTSDQISEQMKKDNAPFYDTYYQKDNNDENIKEACYDYVSYFASQNGYKVSPYKLLKSMQGDIVKQLSANNPSVSATDLETKFEQTVEEASNENIDLDTYSYNELNNLYNNFGRASNLALNLGANQFFKGEFTSSTSSDDDQDVADFLDTNSQLLTSKPDDLNIDKFFTRMFDYKWSNPQVSFEDTSEYEGDIYETPFLAQYGIKISARIIPQTENGKFFLIKENMDTETNDMKVAFTFNLNSEKSETTKDLSFNFTTKQFSNIFDRVEKNNTQLKWAGLVNENYNPLLQVEGQVYYGPFATDGIVSKGFDKQTAIDKDEWYKENAHTSSFPYAVGDILPDDFAQHFLSITYGDGKDDFDDEVNFLVPGYVNSTTSWRDDTIHTFDEAAAYYQSKGLFKGKFVAKVDQLGNSTDHPYATFDLCYQYDTPSGTKIQTITTESDYAHSRCPEAPVADPLDRGADAGMLELYWNKDEMEQLQVADYESTIGLDNIQYFNKLGSLETDESVNEAERGVKTIEDYTNGALTYVAIQAALSAILLSISSAEYLAAYANFSILDVGVGAALLLQASTDAINAGLCILVVKDVSDNLDDLDTVSKSLYEYIHKWGDASKGINNRIVNLEEASNSYADAKSFPDKMSRANDVINATYSVGVEVFDIITNFADEIKDVSAMKGYSFPDFKTFFTSDTVLIASGVFGVLMTAVTGVLINVMLKASIRGVQTADAINVAEGIFKNYKTELNTATDKLVDVLNIALKNHHFDDPKIAQYCNEAETYNKLTIDAESKFNYILKKYNVEFDLVNTLKYLSIASFLVNALVTIGEIAWTFLQHSLLQKIVDELNGSQN